ncbi:MAG: hypothetical protein ACRD0K_15395 [Egibacteraceae bacterium]
MATQAQGQTSLDAFLADTGDGRARRIDGSATTVAELAAAERLRPAPEAPYPVRDRRRRDRGA